MKPKLYLILLISLPLLILSCKTAKKLYEKGHYDEAVSLAAKKLQKDPNDPKLLSVLKDAYTFAVDDHQAGIREHAESNSELKWEWMYNEYAALQKIYNAIFNVPSVYNLIRPVDYSSYLATYAEKAGDIRYERGLSFMEQARDKQTYRKAYREFQSALNFKPGQAAIMDKLEKAYDNAVTNVVILPLQQNGGYTYSGYTLGGQNFDDQLIRNLQTSSGNDFVKFYSAWEARGNRVRTDQILDMQLTTIDIGRFHDQRSNRRVSKEVLIKETVYRPDSIVKEYGWVHADITSTRRTVNSNALLQVNVRDDNGSWLWNDNFRAEHNWSTEFASYTGDQRALSDHDKQLINRNKEYPPDDQEITRCLLTQISGDAQYRIKNYFERL